MSLLPTVHKPELTRKKVFLILKEVIVVAHGVLNHILFFKIGRSMKERLDDLEEKVDKILSKVSKSCTENAEGE